MHFVLKNTKNDNVDFVTLKVAISNDDANWLQQQKFVVFLFNQIDNRHTDLVERKTYCAINLQTIKIYH